MGTFAALISMSLWTKCPEENFCFDDNGSVRCSLIKAASANGQEYQALLQCQLLFRKRDSIQQSALHEFPLRRIPVTFQSRVRDNLRTIKQQCSTWDLSDGREARLNDPPKTSAS